MPALSQPNCTCFATNNIQQPAYRHSEAIDLTPLSSPNQKRQVVLPPFDPAPASIVRQLATAIYITQVIRNGGNLWKACQNVNVRNLGLTGINGELAKERICAAARIPPAPADTSTLNEIIALATGLYAVEVAGKYAGGTNLTNLCNVIDVVTINALNYDGQRVKDFVCAAASNAPAAPACTTPVVDPVPTSAEPTTTVRLTSTVVAISTITPGAPPV